MGGTRAIAVTQPTQKEGRSGLGGGGNVGDMGGNGGRLAGAPVAPAEGGPKIVKPKSSWHRSKTVAVSLKHWKGRSGGGGGG